MVKSSAILREESLNGLAWSHFDLFGDVSFYSRDVRRCNVIFTHQKHTKYFKTSVLQSKLLTGFLHAVAEIWKICRLQLHLLCVRIEISNSLQNRQVVNETITRTSPVLLVLWPCYMYVITLELRWGISFDETAVSLDCCIIKLWHPINKSIDLGVTYLHKHMKCLQRNNDDINPD